MKNLITMALMALCLHAAAQTKGYQPGSVVPELSLKNVDNKMVSFKDYKDARGYIVVFTCNTCPVSQAYEERLIKLHKDYAAKGFPVIAINPNDPEVSGGDDFKLMQERAKSKGFPFAYLFDPGQTVTRQFGAERTPHVYLLSKDSDAIKVEYIGAIDNDPENTGTERKAFLEDALKALLSGNKPVVTFTKAVGCGVKFKG
ncbi:MAG TPA: thioredoxin family protein [Pedobacter sp.]|uniref:thioredoxin family protein n=1 Tax=Pedobacter sp. TaxID=1411316 RepID=UPI002BAA42D3|nr:thioredoxin family protein [Pedobacter sp.]HMI02280.1 thioredoxin family protein [Pedobacter sp.]